MRFSRSLIPTLKENPADAEVVSHKLMVRAGMLRQVARGVYDLLPLGLRVVRKVERIVREEMNRAGAQEILMPVVCPGELWQESGRWEHYGKELLRFQDRNQRDFCLGPTHEELVTDIVRREVRSYRDLPLNLYQIQTKFRDEIRPRFGLMRGREFIMKDAYSFHVDYADCEREYRAMSAAYTRIFERCGLRFRPVEAATGAIGGSMSHEFHVLAESGEDALVSCTRCGYAANVEKAALPAAPPVEHAAAPKPLREVQTLNQRTVEDVSAFLSVPPERFIKTLLFVVDGGETVAALVRGDHELSEAKLLQVLGCQTAALADAATVERHTGAAVGFAGPIGLRGRIIADQAIRGLVGAVTGANATDQHLVDVAQARDLPDLEFADLRTAQPGDPCGRCDDGVYEGHRGIEVGQVFYLGTKYSKAMGATFLDASGQEQLMEMGCYGIGITRTAAAAVEQNHDDNGIIWPLALAPAQVHLIAVNPKDEAQRTTAERLYAELNAAGLEVLYDDREERPGVKFKDADLIGVPFRVTVGPKALARGAVEFKARRAGEVEELPLGDAVTTLARLARESGEGMSVYSILGAPTFGQMQSRLIFALDVGTMKEAIELVALLRNEVGMFKVGKQLFLAAGPDVVRGIKHHGGEVFLDLKFHDIPRTVAKAGAEATRLGVRMFDLHASGSMAMMRQAILEVNKICRTEHLVRPKLLAVTVLTSLNQDDLKRLGVRSGVESQVVRLARLAREAGMDGVVASPHEVARIRKECGRKFLIVTPGVRPPKGSMDDQKRGMTPEAAIRAGANYLVVGSPIRDASDPVAAARAIVAAMERGAGLAVADLRG